MTSGLDSTCKLWELSTNRCLIGYTGAGSTGKQEFSIQATFNHNEDFVMFPDEKSGSLCSWDSRTGDRKRLLALGEYFSKKVNKIRNIFRPHSCNACFCAQSNNGRFCYWFRRFSLSFLDVAQESSLISFSLSVCYYILLFFSSNKIGQFINLCTLNKRL